MLTELGKQVKVKLINEGMSQTDLAIKIDVSPQHLGGVLHGSPSLRMEELLKDWLTDKKVKAYQRKHKCFPKKKRRRKS
jgi:transcriptional regulator with XRE-family HTH domain